MAAQGFALLCAHRSRRPRQAGSPLGWQPLNRGVRTVAQGDPWEPWDRRSQQAAEPSKRAILACGGPPISHRENRPFQGLRTHAAEDPGLPRVALGYAQSPPAGALALCGFVGKAHGLALRRRRRLLHSFAPQSLPHDPGAHSPTPPPARSPATGPLAPSSPWQKSSRAACGALGRSPRCEISTNPPIRLRSRALTSAQCPRTRLRGASARVC